MTPRELAWWALALAKARALGPDVEAAMQRTYECAQRRALGD